MFSAFHIVRLERNKKNVAPNITAWSIWNYKKIVSSLFFDVLKGCFEYKKVFFRKNYVPTLHVSKPSKFVGNSCMYFF